MDNARKRNPTPRIGSSTFGMVEENVGRFPGNKLGRRLEFALVRRN
jgi:hypothetical protein